MSVLITHFNLLVIVHYSKKQNESSSIQPKRNNSLQNNVFFEIQSQLTPFLLALHNAQLNI